MNKGRLLTIILAVGGALVARSALSPLTDRGAWVDEGVMGRAYPRTERALADLSRRGVKFLVNLHERAHDPSRLRRHGLAESHLPVGDFTAPSSEQLARGVAAIVEARGRGAVAVHCGGGLGRTGTLLACYLVHEKDLEAEQAIRRVRKLRPGSVETRAQVAAVEAYARRRSAETRRQEPLREKVPDPSSGQRG